MIVFFLDLYVNNEYKIGYTEIYNDTNKEYYTIFKEPYLYNNITYHMYINTQKSENCRYFYEKIYILIFEKDLHAINLKNKSNKNNN